MSFVEAKNSNTEYIFRADRYCFALVRKNHNGGYIPWTGINLPMSVSLGFSTNKREIGIAIIRPNVCSRRRSITAVLEKNGYSRYLELAFTPPKSLTRDKSFDGRRTLFGFCLEEWQDFAQKLQNNPKVSYVNEIRGTTNSYMARFAVRHLGFEYMYSLEPGINTDKDVYIRTTRKSLLTRMEILEKMGVASTKGF